jgi:hypothetical protein
MRTVLFWLIGDHDILGMELWHGGAAGADLFCAGVADRLGVRTRRFDVDWAGPCRDICKPGHRASRAQWGNDTYCPMAGMYRNDDMITALSPHLGTAVVLAFPVKGLANRGTTDCRDRALAAGLPTLVFPLEPA